MKVCVFNENYQRGGIETFLYSLLNAWPNKDDEFTIFINSENPFNLHLKKSVSRSVKIVKYKNRTTRQANRLVDVLSISRTNFFKLTKNRILECINIILFPILVLTIYKKLKVLDVDVLLVVNGGYPGGINCRAASVAGWILLKRDNVVFSFHNYAVDSKIIRKILEAPIDFLVSRSAKTFVSVSENCLNSIDKRFFLRSNHNRQVIFNGIEDPQLLNSRSEGLDNEATEDYCVVIGTLESRKGHDFLLDAFKYVVEIMPSMILLIVGKGNAHDEERIATKITHLGLGENVFLRGYIEDVHELIRSCSVLLVPSQSYESFGLTIIEAMAMEVPVVATDVGGIPEVLGSNIGGVICPKNNPKFFGLSILQFLENREYAEKVGREGRARFDEKFTSHAMAVQYRHVLQGDLKLL
jgi:glycosyltransferase involved in cell wall biosynthesis